jgi:hypothetical protein
MARGLLVWLLIMLAETVHGVLRGLLAVPRMGEEAAARLGWPIGLVLVLVISYLCIRWTRVRGSGQLLLMGGVWAVLTTAFEVMIGLMRGMDLPRILAEIHPLTGTILYSAAVMLIAPLAADRLRRRR